MGTRAAFLEKEWLICRVLHSHWTELCFRVSCAHQRASCLQVFATAVPWAWDAFSLARLHWTNTRSLKTSSVIGPSRKPSLNAPHQPLWKNSSPSSGLVRTHFYCPMDHTLKCYNVCHQCPRWPLSKDRNRVKLFFNAFNSDLAWTILSNTQQIHSSHLLNLNILVQVGLPERHSLYFVVSLA